MRESYRLQKSVLSAGTNALGISVFFIYNGNTIPEYKLVFEKIGIAIQRLNKILNETGALHT